MEINKKELRKISRRFRTLASNVMNSHCDEQNTNLIEMLDYIGRTSLINEYIQSLYYDINGLDTLLNDVNASFGRKTIELGSDSNNRTYFLYQVFSYITRNNLPTYNFGWYYTNSHKYQDMAKAFGDRLIYPFVVEIENYLKDIATDMGYDESNAVYNININSSGVQVNIAEHGSTINAGQENKFNSEELIKTIEEVENLINNLQDDTSKIVLNQNLNTLKNEIKKKHPEKEILVTCLKTMHLISTSIALIPDLTTGIQMIASLIGMSIG